MTPNDIENPRVRRQTKKMAILRLNAAMLRDALQLPDGAEVVRVFVDEEFRCRLNVVIEGAGWETAEGAPIQPAGPGIVTVDRDEHGGIKRMTIDWGLPAQGAEG